MDPKVADIQETGLLDLPEEVIRKVMSFLSESDRVWKIGMSCRALLHHSLLNVHQIEIPFLSDSITIELLRYLLQEKAAADWIRYVMLLGSQSNRLFNTANDELPGNLFSMSKSLSILILNCIEKSQFTNPKLDKVIFNLKILGTNEDP